MVTIKSWKVQELLRRQGHRMDSLWLAKVSGIAPERVSLLVSGEYRCLTTKQDAEAIAEALGVKLKDIGTD